MSFTGQIGQVASTPGNIELGIAPTVSFGLVIVGVATITNLSLDNGGPFALAISAKASVSPGIVVHRSFGLSVLAVASILQGIETASNLTPTLTKNFGPNTSGYLDPSLRGWETVVYEMGKPILDRELNLSQDIDGGAGQLALTTAMPSGWISDDFTGSSDATASIFEPQVQANFLRIPQNQIAHVNGWMLVIANTTITDHNLLILPTPPVGTGVVRVDLVVLEVWRKLISPAPSTDGKSALARIWRYGNVKTDPVNDASLNLPDDLEESDVGTETTKRVQIQYRLRVITGVNLMSYPYGMDDPNVRANSVPPNASTPDGSATTFTYLTGTNSIHPTDTGLWIAGDGNPSNTLNTVDGYMYAIPFCAVVRRNSSGFNRVTNQNGGQPSPGPSDRPDGLLADVIDDRDIIDLRLGVSPVGWDYPEVLDKNFTYLLDNTLQTELIQTTLAGTQQGTLVLWNDQIGVSTTNGGSAPNSGSSGTGGPLIGQFDAVRRTFSDRVIYEVVTVAVPPPGGGWASGSFTINFSSLAVYPYSAFNWLAYVPNVVAYDIVGAHFIGGSGKKSFNALGHLASVTGLGVVPIGNLTITMDALTGLGVTTETLYVDVLVCYPPGGGLSKTPTTTYGTSSFSINNPSQLPSTSPINYSALINTNIDSVHREVQIEYTTTLITITMAADTTISSDSTFRLPERAATIDGPAILKNGSVLVGTVTLGTDGRTVTFNNSADYTNPGDTLQVPYTAVRPLPQNNEQVSVWYETAAPQTGRDSIILGSLQVIPRYIPPHLYAITTGSGSQDTGYPFPYAYVQTGGIYPSSTGTYNGEHQLDSRGAISVANFNAQTGFLRLPVMTPFMPDPEQVTFSRVISGDIDIEGRTFFSQATSAYLPNAYAQDLSDPKTHKIVLPVLAELAAPSAYGQKGQLVMLLLIRWAIFDETNGIYYDSNATVNTTVASIFRIKGHLLNRRNL